MIIENFILIIIGFCIIPLGFLLNKITHDEIEIYKKFFLPILWILAIFSAIFLSISKLNAVTTIYMFIMIFFWLNADKIKKLFKKN